MLDPKHGNDDMRKQRYGTCHRCGWKGSVSKVDRQDRKQLGTGRTFGRLCDDCVDDLLMPHGASVFGPPKHGKLKSGRSRHVA